MITVNIDLIKAVHASMKSCRLSMENPVNLEEVEEVDTSADEYLLTHQKELAYIQACQNEEFELIFDGFLD